MNNGEAMAAELLSMSGNAYAAYASNRLLEKVPEAKQQFGDSSFARWKDHFFQRINELSAAMSENEPALFLSRVQWARAAFRARSVPEYLLRESLICLNEVLEEEMPEGCENSANRFIASGLKLLEDTLPGSTELDSADPVSNLAMHYLVQVLEGNSHGAIELIIDAHKKGLSLEESFQVLIVAQREVGRMWHHAEVNVAEEHIVTATTERAMSVLAYNAERKPSNGLTVVSAAVTGNTHDLGVHVVSNFFEFSGWRAICLGGDLPTFDIAQAIQFFDTSLVLLSAALVTQIRALRETVQAIRELDTKCKIMVGGAAFIDAPELWRQLGADAFASTPGEAVATATSLIQEK